MKNLRRLLPPPDISDALSVVLLFGTLFAFLHFGGA
jgi:hypothetical protein